METIERKCPKCGENLRMGFFETGESEPNEAKMLCPKCDKTQLKLAFEVLEADSISMTQEVW